MAEEGKSEAVAQPATSPAADEDVKMEEDGKENDQEEVEEFAENGDSSTLSRDHWAAMRNVVEIVNTHKVTIRGEEHYPAQLFRRVVNKRLLPDYYEVIKEPIALSTIKQKLLRKTYTEFNQFVRDLAQIVHNAKLYNRPNSGAYNDALVLEEVAKGELEKLVEVQLITKEETEFPYLGEIPEATPEPDPPEEEDEPEEEADDDDDDDDDEDSDEDKAGRRRRAGRKSLVGKKRDDDDDKKGVDGDSRKRRGRPPRVDTPMEARIKAVLKGIRKFKDDQGNLKILPFERLPDKIQNPEYYETIQNPIAIDLIKRKSKRKKYKTLDEFMRDMDQMFENAKFYNEDNSPIYNAAGDLQIQAHKIMEEEKKKPDAELAGEDGRFPLPQGILHNNEVYKVGDWVHIQNPNDVTKPIVAQIYRTWQDNEKQMWINACWYYRPEQTVHQYEKHFFPNEVVKTGQYRDHHIDEVVDRCFVMFFTRYSRGRPRGLDPDREVYVCEARYNEEKHRLNKIKTWASCLPDEVREVDYEMDLFDVPRRIKKLPSPLLHLLKDDAKEVRSASDIPSPKWGAPNAPPIVGAIYKGARDENQSPPPEPTPPPPTPPPAAVRPTSYSLQPQPQPSMVRGLDPQGDTTMVDVQPRASMPSASPAPSNPPMASQQVSSRPQSSASPAPGFQRQDSFSRQPQQSGGFTPQTPSQGYGAPASAPYNHYNQPQMQSHRQQNTPAATPGLGPGYTVSNSRGVETYVMSDTANAAIPLEIRQQFQTDEQGRVLFFTAPPLDQLPRVQPETGRPLSHSPAYLLKKLEKDTAAVDAVDGEDSRRDIGNTLSLKQKRFLELNRLAEAREESQRASGNERDQVSIAPKSKSGLIDRVRHHDDQWMHGLYAVSSGEGQNETYEGWLKIEEQRQQERRQLWQAQDVERDRVLSMCAGDTAELRRGSKGAKVAAARKRLGDRDCKLEEKVKLRKMIREYRRENYKKPVYQDDIDPRYGPM